MYMPTYSKEWMRDVREDGNFIGGILLLLVSFLTLGFTVVAAVLFLSGVLNVEQLSQEDLGLGNTGYMLLYACAYTVFAGLPTLLTCLLFHRPLPKVMPTIAYVPSRTKGLAFLIGMGGCSAANFVASYVTAVLDSFGISSPETPTFLEATPQSLLLNLLVLAVLPAILEEIVFRKCVLGTLQKYGNGLAICVSALFFGLVHGGISQSVFAFLVGLVLGYITVRSGNIRIAIMVHLCNNALSVVTEYLTIGMEDTMRGVAYTALLVVTGFCGLIALVVSLVGKDVLFAKTSRPATVQYAGDGMLWGAPLMVIAIVLMVLRIIYLNVV